MARPRKFDEQQVLDTARELFWSGGYAATRMEDIAAATGLGKGSLYGAFGGSRNCSTACSTITAAPSSMR